MSALSSFTIQFRFPFLPFFFFLLPSRLKILNARLSDSGNYSCVPTSGESSSVMVHVINGEWGRMPRMFNMITNKSNNAKIVFDFSFSSCLPLSLCVDHHSTTARWTSSSNAKVERIQQCSTEPWQSDNHSNISVNSFSFPFVYEISIVLVPHFSLLISPR